MELSGGRWQVLAVGLAGLCGLAILHVFDPATHAFFLECPLYARTGLRCAGCGGQRALHALLHGEVRQALALNLLAVLCVPLAAYLYTVWTLRVWTGLRLPLPRATPLHALLAVAALLAYAVLRNLPEFAALTQR